MGFLLFAHKYPSAGPCQKGIWVAGRAREILHCLSYTEVAWNFLPVESVPFTVTVRVLPSAERTMRPVPVALPSFLMVSSSVWSSIFFNDRMSELESPVTEESLPSYLPAHPLCVGLPALSTPSTVTFTLSP